MFAVVVIAITALNVRTVLSSDRSYDVNTSTIEAISGEDDPIDGGEIGGVTITCDTGGSGRCYIRNTIRQDNQYCRVFCGATGNTGDYCSAFWSNVIDFCSNLGF
ncbi:hypothetical protein KSY15_02320 [Bacteroides cellulosilyticus]|nr:hypothetical protein [Bacteroides cellulosilyticus]MBV3661354.1 hypothetical protein [Bacteroides cellulosilyticus]MBV3683382.1 hypothetical protein [Bacteroides cellulosilyticus]MBV3692372.1 hypothetical protein [Bacteroides cellulosilyticus]MBV3706008.1 hypothetical protein [Bacteroides cellulosilyticus]